MVLDIFHLNDIAKYDYLESGIHSKDYEMQ